MFRNYAAYVLISHICLAFATQLYHTKNGKNAFI